MQCLIRVEIATGRRLEDNLRELWEARDRNFEQAEQTDPAGGAGRAEPAGQLMKPAGGRPPACASPPPACANPPPARRFAPEQPSDVEDALLRRVRRFNAGRRRRRDQQDWSDEDIYRLAVCMGRHNQKAGHAAAQLARSPRSCRRMFARLKKAGVV